LTESKKGTPGFVLRFRVLCNVDEPEAPLEQYQRGITWWLTDNTWEWLKSDLESLGYTGPDFSSLDPDTPKFHCFRDLEIEVRCKHEKNEEDGELYERWYLRNGKRKLKDRSKLAHFNQLMRRKSERENGGDVGVGVGITDADVPF
jgi:hypothetical protein